MKLHDLSIVLDAHVDTILRIFDKKIDFGQINPNSYVDIPRLKSGGVKIQFFAVWIDPLKYPDDKGMNRARTLIQTLNNEFIKYPNDIQRVDSIQDALDIIKTGRIAGLLALEGGYAIGQNIDNLDELYQLGIRYMTLTWMNSHQWADSSEDKSRWNGLSPFGKKVIRKMNQLGMLIDLSHSSDRTAEQVFDLTNKPVIFSHSGARIVYNHPRNISDDLLKKLKSNNGVVGVIFYNKFLSDESKDKITVETVIKHIEHIIDIAGIDHVGLGSDYDGANQYPLGLDNCSSYPVITEALLKKGYTDIAIRKILGENFIRVFQNA